MRNRCKTEIHRGGFRFLTWDNEGTEVAEWLQARGIAAFVLKYRTLDMGQTEQEFQKKMQEFFQQMQSSGSVGARKHRYIEMAK